MTVVSAFPASGGRVVIRSSDEAAGPPELAARQAQTFEGLWAGDLMHEMAVYVEYSGTEPPRGGSTRHVPNDVPGAQPHQPEEATRVCRPAGAAEIWRGLAALKACRFAEAVAATAANTRLPAG